MKTWPGFKEQKADFDFKWFDIAFDHIKVMLQKKLFNVQCLWRAEQLEIKEIKISYAFRIWEDDVLNCQFIEPVTAEEIELYISFLETTEREMHHYYEWQDYEEIKKAFNDGKGREDVYLEWYAYYDVRRGTNKLFMLADIRGEKEAFYIKLEHEENWKHNGARYTAEEEERERNRDKREVLKYYEDAIIKSFVETFESETVRTCYDNYEWALRNYDKMENMESHLELLYEANEEIAMDAHENWMDAMKITAETYKTKKNCRSFTHGLGSI